MSFVQNVWSLARSLVRLVYRNLFRYLRILAWPINVIRYFQTSFNPSRGQIMPKPRYKPIDKAKNQIRLLRILPLRDHPRAFGVESMPQGRNVVVCTIEVVSLDDSLEYAALSYVWGDYIPRMVVFVDGRPVETSFSLEGALQALQHETKPVFVWADALCINQADNLERHHQVQLMARIYKTATSVFVWLGCPLSRLEETMEITSDKAMDFLDDLGLKALEFGILNLDISDVNNILSSDVREDLHGIRDSLEALVEQKMFNIPWHDLNFFFCYPWFSRIWVIQEAAVTRNRPVVFTCGEKKLPLRHLQASLAFIDYFRMRFAMNFPWEDFTDPEKSLYWTAMNECNTWRPTRLLRARRIYQEEGSRKRRNLYELLIDMHVDYAARDQLQASDPHDRIFALLGMATSALGLKADYNASCVEAYTLAAAAMLKEGHLDLLALNQSPEARTISHEDSELPTWAPNWSSRIYRPCGGYMKDECYQASGQEKSFVDFRSLPKGGNTWTSQLRRCFNYSVNSSSLPPVLLIAGCTVDEIAKVGTPWMPTPEDYKEWAFNLERTGTYFSEIDEFCKESDRLDNDIYQDPQTRLEAPWRIPCVNIRHHQNRRCRPSPDGAELQECYKLVKAGILQGADDAQNHKLAGYRVAIGGLFKRRPFISLRGYVGLVPSHAEAGDLLCILYGCIIPYVLRRRIPGIGYELVGESYVHGIMDGEFVAKKHTTETYELY